MSAQLVSSHCGHIARKAEWVELPDRQVQAGCDKEFIRIKRLHFHARTVRCG